MALLHIVTVQLETTNIAARQTNLSVQVVNINRHLFQQILSFCSQASNAGPRCTLPSQKFPQYNCNQLRIGDSTYFHWKAHYFKLIRIVTWVS